MKRLFWIIALIMIVVPFSACDNEKKTIVVTGVNFVEEEVFLSQGQSAKLDIKIYPNNATNQKIEFSSSNESAVSVAEDGTVTMNGTQPAVITVRTVDGGKQDSCLISPEVNVTALSFSTLNFETKYDSADASSEELLMLSVGQEKRIRIDIEPLNASRVNLTLTSSDASVVRVIDETNAIIRGLKTGRVTIVAEIRTLNEQNEEVVYKDGCDVLVTATPHHFEVSASVDKFQTDPSAVELIRGAVESGLISVKLSDFVSAGTKFLIAINLEAADFATKINQKSISFSVSDETVFEAKMFDVADFLPSNKYDQSNFTNWIEIIPKADGSAILFVTSDAKDENGKSKVLQITIFVNANVDKVEVESDLVHFSTIGNLPIARKGQNFSLFTKIYEGVGEEATVFEELTSTMREAYYFLPAASQNFVSLFNPCVVSGGLQFSMTNQFIVKSVKEAPAEIWVAVAKTDSSAPITKIVFSAILDKYTIYSELEGELEDVTEEYALEKFEFFARPVLSGISVKQNGVETSSEIVCFNLPADSFGLLNLNTIISYSSFSNQLLVEAESNVQPVSVQVSSNNEAVVKLNVDGEFEIIGKGTCTLSFVASDGRKTFTREIDVTVLPPLVKMEADSELDEGEGKRVITLRLSDIVGDGYQIDLLSLTVYAVFLDGETVRKEIVFPVLTNPAVRRFEVDATFFGDITFAALEVGALVTISISNGSGS